MVDEEVTEKLRAHLKLLEERFPGMDSQVAYSDRYETPCDLKIELDRVASCSFVLKVKSR